MAKVILICGKICSGKSRYAKQLKENINAVILSCDELILSLFPDSLGERHDTIVSRAKQYLYGKSADIVRTGIDAILDFGFWSRKERAEVSDFYMKSGIPAEWHYVDISDEDWKQNMQVRNDSVLSGESKDYYVDGGLIEKLNSLFETPSREEMDYWYIVSRCRT